MQTSKREMALGVPGTLSKLAAMGEVSLVMCRFTLKPLMGHKVKGKYDENDVSFWKNLQAVLELLLGPV